MKDGWGEALSVIEIDAKPSQAFATSSIQAKNRANGKTRSDWEEVENSYMYRVLWQMAPFPAPLSDREILIRVVNKKLDYGRGYMISSYSIEDERKPLTKGATRLTLQSATLYRAKKGSNGEVCEALRLLRVQPNFGAVVGVFLNRVRKGNIRPHPFTHSHTHTSGVREEGGGKYGRPNDCLEERNREVFERLRADAARWAVDVEGERSVERSEGRARQVQNDRALKQHTLFTPFFARPAQRIASLFRTTRSLTPLFFLSLTLAEGAASEDRYRVCLGRSVSAPRAL